MAIQHERMHMHVEIEGPTEPLDDGHGAPAPIHHVVPARAAAQPAQHRAQVDRDDRSAQIVVPRQPIAQAIRQTQHPLPHGHIGEDVVHQAGVPTARLLRGGVEMRGPLGHPTTFATSTPSRTIRAPGAPAQTETASLAREGDQPIQAAGRTTKPREPAGQRAAAQEVTKLLLDEPGQALTVAQTGRLRTEGLEVRLHDLVEHARGGTPRFVASGRLGHPP
jgi:hypothetical protein